MKKGRLKDAPEWPDIVRDYRAGDPQLVLEARYGWFQQTIGRNLATIGKLRTGSISDTVRMNQIREADDVRFRLRTGVLNRVADDLDIPVETLRDALERHGLFLHDLT